MIKEIIDKRYSRGQWAASFYAVIGLWIVTMIGMMFLVSIRGNTNVKLKQTNTALTNKILKLTSQIDDLEIRLTELKTNNDQLKAIEFNTLVEPSVIKGIIQIESAGDPKAYNASEGAVGLMQLRPIVYNKICSMTKKEAFNPKKNIACGSLYFKHLLNRFNGNLEHALAFYNSGKPLKNGYAEKVKKNICKGKNTCLSQLLIK